MDTYESSQGIASNRRRRTPYDGDMTPTSTSTTFDGRFRELTRRWNAHQALRRSGAPIAELAESRLALDDARAKLRDLCL